MGLINKSSKCNLLLDALLVSFKLEIVIFAVWEHSLTNSWIMGLSLRKDMFFSYKYMSYPTKHIE